MFDLKRVQKAGAVFNQDKLDWLQREHMKNLSTAHMVDRLETILAEKGISTTRPFLVRVVELERLRIKTFSEFLETAGFFFTVPNYEPTLLIWQNEPVTKIKTVLEETLEVISALTPKEFQKESLLVALERVIQKEGRGTVLWPLRVALSGLRASPDPLEIMEVLQKKESEKRIKCAIDKIKA